MLNKFLKGTYTKAEAVLDLLINKEVIDMSYGNLMKRWTWRSKKKVFCFIKGLISDDIIKINPDGKKVMAIKIKELKTEVKIKKEGEISRNIYREYKHLILYQEEYNNLLNDYKPEDIEDVLLKIENSQDNGKYRSFYKTAQIWLSTNKAKGILQSQLKDTTKHKGKKVIESENIEFKIIFDFEDFVKQYGTERIVEVKDFDRHVKNEGGIAKVIKDNNYLKKVFRAGETLYFIKKITWNQNTERN